MDKLTTRIQFCEPGGLGRPKRPTISLYLVFTWMGEEVARWRCRPRFGFGFLLDFCEKAGCNTSMSKTAARFSAGLLMFAFSASLVLAGGRAPDVIYLKAGPRTDPIWISAEAATSEKGDVRWEWFSSANQDHLRRFLADSERLRRAGESSQRNQAADKRGTELKCPLVLATLDEHRIDPKPNNSFSDLAEQALAIYSGRIEGISQGFFSDLPSSLLQVRVTEAFRSSPLVADDEVLIPYPFARFRIGSSTFCGGAHGMFEPAVGDRVLVFIYDPASNAAGTLVHPRSREIFFQSSAGHLIVPHPLKTDRDLAAAESLDDLEKLLRPCGFYGFHQNGASIGLGIGCHVSREVACGD